MTLLVVGNASVDVCLAVGAFPAPGETVLARGHLRDAGGKGLNQAVAAARAGARVVFATAIGDGPDAHVIEARLAENRLGSPAQLRWIGPSDMSVILSDAAGRNMIVSTNGMAKSLHFADIQACFEPLAAGDIVLLQGNLSHRTTGDCLRQARSRGAFTVLNPAPIAFDCIDLLPLCDLVVVNEIEAVALGDSADLTAASIRILDAGCGSVVVTSGAAGARIVSANATCEISAPQTEAVDTSGAGDVLVGVLCAGLLEGMLLRDACAWGVRAASASVTRRGTSGSCPDPAEMQRLR